MLTIGLQPLPRWDSPVMSTATTMPQHQFCLPGIEEPHRDGVAYLDELVREAGEWLAALVEFLPVANGYLPHP